MNREIITMEVGDHIRVVSNSITTTGRGSDTLCGSTNKNEPFGARRQAEWDIRSFGDELSSTYYVYRGGCYTYV